MPSLRRSWLLPSAVVALGWLGITLIVGMFAAYGNVVDCTSDKSETGSEMARWCDGGPNAPYATWITSLSLIAIAIALGTGVAIFLTGRLWASLPVGVVACGAVVLAFAWPPAHLNARCTDHTAGTPCLDARTGQPEGKVPFRKPRPVKLREPVPGMAPLGSLARTDLGQCTYARDTANHVRVSGKEGPAYWQGPGRSKKPPAGATVASADLAVGKRYLCLTMKLDGTINPESSLALELNTVRVGHSGDSAFRGRLAIDLFHGKAARARWRACDESRRATGNISQSGRVIQAVVSLGPRCIFDDAGGYFWTTSVATPHRRYDSRHFRYWYWLDGSPYLLYQPGAQRRV